MRRASCGTVLLLLSFLSGVQVAMGQNNSLPPQPGFSAERTLAGGQSHGYTIGLEQNQFLKLVFDQRGIDVVVRTFSPAGERLGEFDSPNGTNGPENVTVVATSPGKYRIEVTPLDSSRNLQPGRYEIRIADLRNATDQEVKAGKSREILKAKGVALLLDVIQGPDQLHRPEARAGMEIRAAHLLWDADEKHALLFMQEAMDNVISAAALALNGFGQKYYEDGEVIVDNGNPVGGAANDLANTLGVLAPANFERAKAAANRIRLADVRLRAYASIAEQAIQSTR